jgi:hypothetical protein
MWDNVRKGKETRCVGGRGKMIVVGNVEARDVLGKVVSERWFQKGDFRKVVSAKVVSAFGSWQDYAVQ